MSIPWMYGEDQKTDLPPGTASQTAYRRLRMLAGVTEYGNDGTRDACSLQIYALASFGNCSVRRLPGRRQVA